MTSRSRRLEEACSELSRRDRRLAPLIDRHGPPILPLRRDRFGSLVEAIVSQQISGKGAETILGRVRGRLREGITPEGILVTADDVLSNAGLSAQKLRSLRSLAEQVEEGGLNLKTLGRSSDDEIISRLTEVRGIGPWTAQMFLMFTIGRLDVLPCADLGVQKGVQIVYALADHPTPAHVKEIARRRRWSPFRSIASWYMWRALDDSRRS